MQDSPTTTHPRTLVVIPAYNEADSIAAVLEDLARWAPWAQPVVVDDGSTDGTVQAARAAGAPVICLPCNLGVGGAVQTGYQYALQQGYEAAIQFDGDGQHRAAEIPRLMEALVARQVDLVIGSRLAEDKVRFRFNLLRLVGSRLLSALISRITRQQVSDPTSGFRAASARAIRFFARHYPQTYLGDTAEAVVWASRSGLTIAEIPTRMRQRRTGSSATGSLRGFLHTLRIVLAVLVDCLERPET
jgi:glycosyltransferase involved in cell wall biosynthesis